MVPLQVRDHIIIGFLGCAAHRSVSNFVAQRRQPPTRRMIEPPAPI